jgi:hypothetical protein
MIQLSHSHPSRTGISCDPVLASIEKQWKAEEQLKLFGKRRCLSSLLLQITLGCRDEQQFYATFQEEILRDFFVS